jgi:hypothetical protein
VISLPGINALNTMPLAAIIALTASAIGPQPIDGPLRPRDRSAMALVSPLAVMVIAWRDPGTLARLVSINFWMIGRKVGEDMVLADMIAAQAPTPMVVPELRLDDAHGFISATVIIWLPQKETDHGR